MALRLSGLKTEPAGRKKAFAPRLGKFLLSVTVITFNASAAW
ncbi:hypothetical protein P296_00465 [Salmonella enterica subsp. arizonae serovar 18:z4,z23:- str. CVM N26624]|uniref:Uncharacterized protein n=1 Tax=Salmonella enterica subsp. arizonae serovar 18:z4,z23:- str. CVM N26626 TaxID=1395119 RepID=A0A3S5YH51_SALER|nr:hypothetical protein N898_05805 [Salmonella enterica subsp. arizonae serovar 62:z36:- str. RKS2983]OLV94231.1 hypothetical protein P297_05770 [Salmonella enterica subsp. arizonae serovar 18:z4,z23:- str. CVM N26625]OLV96469.1 hypothetical protein P298_19130 [Salmonella enterica subsp. arizonae serovar 18:z4,z23:- str. CVM N26626]OLW04418.1 hypothetical protein P296_00465 [Salmonella enterica subsp. arizonae serovar 18:z4,z23:- str. CVM N26624]OLW06977.1 hypothetical protein P295_03325 [Salmo